MRLDHRQDVVGRSKKVNRESIIWLIIIDCSIAGVKQVVRQTVMEVFGSVKLTSKAQLRIGRRINHGTSEAWDLGVKEMATPMPFATSSEVDLQTIFISPDLRLAVT